MNIRLFIVAIVVLFASCSAAVDDTRVVDIVDLDGDVDAGLAQYTAECKQCHEQDGAGNFRGADIRNLSLTEEEIIRTLLEGPAQMPAYSGYPDQVLADLAAYTATL